MLLLVSHAVDILGHSAADEGPVERRGGGKLLRRVVTNIPQNISAQEPRGNVLFRVRLLGDAPLSSCACMQVTTRLWVRFLSAVRTICTVLYCRVADPGTTSCLRSSASRIPMFLRICHLNRRESSLTMSVFRSGAPALARLNAAVSPENSEDDPISQSEAVY
jgi:hypothetical protein